MTVISNKQINFCCCSKKNHNYRLLEKISTSSASMDSLPHTHNDIVGVYIDPCICHVLGNPSFEE